MGVSRGILEAFLGEGHRAFQVGTQEGVEHTPWDERPLLEHLCRQLVFLTQETPPRLF